MRNSFSSHPVVDALPFVSKIEELMSELPKQEARVAQYLLLNRLGLGFETGASIAKKTGTSEVTVSRLLHRLGYQGMRGLKREIEVEGRSGPVGIGPEERAVLEDNPLREVFSTEVRALVNVYQQFDGPLWRRLVETVSRANCVYATGFQTVRGAAEDFARRLALARDDVRFLSAHDGMLAEWMGAGNGAAAECLVIIDVVPYAREAPLLAKMSKACGRDIVVVTDELCHWAHDYTDLVVHAPSRNGLFLESTSALVAVLNMLVHAVSESDPEATRARLTQWKSATRQLSVF